MELLYNVTFPSIAIAFIAGLLMNLIMNIKSRKLKENKIDDTKEDGK